MDYFVINENTGQITVRRSLDRETRDSLQFNVHTSDHGTPSLNASVSVLVTITDVNDNPPELEGRVELAIFENHTTSMPVGRLTVKDPDSGRNSEVSFTQLQCLAYPANNNWSAVTSFGTSRQKDGSALPVEMLYTFFIAKDGRIYSGHAKLDREQYSFYEILVQAEDHGVPRLTASTVVVIHILDVNDNAPHFVYPSSGNNTIYVPRTVRLDRQLIFSAGLS
ncbi:hypothetical protein P879_10050 [Paragonimus westermani]|uniref:Cadherin domain-containing protein n=1 Tax=Paragonimus westermani TaxID=34504 RepID=A0A8T0DCZ2_9TREM|nr:hypothetical protein P879_10050 [Paragonimus westermani]